MKGKHTMKLSTKRSTLKQVRADAVAIFVPSDKKLFQREAGALRAYCDARLDKVIALERFTGEEGQILSFITEKALSSPRLLLIGVGPKDSLTLERFRRAAAAAAKQAAGTHVRHLAVIVPSAELASPLSPSELVQALVEGAYLSQYRFDKYFTGKNRTTKKVNELTLVVTRDEAEQATKRAIAHARIVCEATFLARDLANAPGNEIHPETLAEAARRSAERHGYRATVWDKTRIERSGLGGLVAVSAGSTRPAKFIILEHNAGRTDLDTIVLVGKGVTFDAGGISIKPANGMAEMKMDMSGAAAVIGALEASTRLKLPLHLVGLIPATENLLGGSAMKPGDVITHYGGTTSEVDNTDAEGRLILADALAYASTYKPKAVIDLATLTGACVVALGHHATGMMGNDESLMAALKSAGERSFERVWQLPLYEEFEKQIKSDIADVKNTGGRWGGALTAGLFLKRFVGEQPWVHLDIAGPAMLEEALPYTPKGGSGVGVRLLVEFLKDWKPSARR